VRASCDLNATLANYILCQNCSLYSHKRAFKKHLNVSSPAESDGYVEIIHPRVGELHRLPRRRREARSTSG